MHEPGTARLAAARALQQVLDDGKSLDTALPPLLSYLSDGPDRALARRLCHRVLRDWPAVNGLIAKLLTRPPARRDRLIWFVLAIGLAELREGREPDRAIVHSAVDVAREAGMGRLGGLVNAVLRGFLRRRDSLENELGDSPSVIFGYPGWLIEQVRKDWSDEWQAILEAGNQPPPLWLRVNRRHWSRDQALASLASAGFDARCADQGLPDALRLDQRARISDLPGFAEGGLSVQDAAAQLAVDYLQLADGQRVLDACAAPGGKTTHILERADVELTALDVEAQRLDRVGEALDRLDLEATLAHGDAASPAGWWDGRPFDRILIDAPCSATGVIRRHPDIRWLRKATDIDALVATQADILDALWPLLAPGGILVYATCSVLARENECQARAFLESHEQFAIIDHAELPGRACSPGRQILPGEDDLDGFYYLAMRRLPA